MQVNWDLQLMDQNLLLGQFQLFVDLERLDLLDAKEIDIRGIYSIFLLCYGIIAGVEGGCSI
jgi:hypothetical protein